MAIGRALAMIFSISLLFSSSGCVTMQYPSGGKTFDTPGQALDNTRTDYEEVVARIGPLPQPIANTAVFIIPTWDQVYAAHKKAWQETPASIRAKWSSRYEDAVVYAVDQRELFWTIIPRVLERRKIFTSLKVIHGETGSPPKPPAGGYVIQGEEALKADLYTGVFTISGDNLPPIDPLKASGIVESPRFQLSYGAALDFVFWVENIVKAYRPQGS